MEQLRAVRFVVVHDEPHPCAYLPGRTARLPLRLPRARPNPEQTDALFEVGDRRAGPTFYRPECPGCAACESLRLPMARFAPSKSQRRVRRLCEGQVEAVLGPAQATARHVEIYNRHKRERGLSSGDEDIDLETFRRYYMESGLETREVAYLVDGRLVAFSILDVGERSVSSVYHAFDPDESRRSLGTFSVLREIELFGALGFDWYYLGLWVGDCESLAYKARFFPHQRRTDGVWREYSAADAPGTVVP